MTVGLCCKTDCLWYNKSIDILGGAVMWIVVIGAAFVDIKGYPEGS